MNCGPKPPVPGLIPISALRKKSVSNYKCGRQDSLSSSSPERADSGKEVMGEQRSRRKGTQAPTPIDLIDSARSRGASTGPQAPNTKTKSQQRHRKSEKRRREHKSVHNKRLSSAYCGGSKQKCQDLTVDRLPDNPRVNPIFVWVRQQDTHIVEVKCEDYDKRNRILLTKTAHGWRAIPRTETWVPTTKQSTDSDMKRARKVRKSSKVKRKSTAVQVDPVNDDNETTTENITKPTSPNQNWNSSGDVESHLPSHTILVNRHCSTSSEHMNDLSEHSNENLLLDTTSNFQENIQPQKINATSPLDNLLAVAEFEFNQKVKSGEWNDTSTIETNSVSSPINYDVKIPEQNNVELNPIDFLIKCDVADKAAAKIDNDEIQRTEECDYDDEEDNNLAMNDILNRLEQSLRTPEPKSPEIITENSENQCSIEDPSIFEESKIKEINDRIEEKKIEEIANEISAEFEEKSKVKAVEEVKEIIEEKDDESRVDEPTDLSIGSSIAREESQQDSPKDLVKSSTILDEIDEKNSPTDLSVTVNKECAVPSPRPYSRSSETVQSPQPSGLPPVPPSPDVFPTFTPTNKNQTKSVFLETLLSSQNKQDVQMEPLDLGTCRKSASPTVTCSEEVKKRTFAEADESEAKKPKLESPTLKNMLNPESEKIKTKDLTKENSNHKNYLEQSKLMELLTTDTEVDPATQLKQLRLDPSVDLPDPLLIPKENLSQVLMSPKVEIPRLLTQRPELRLPEALAYPHLLQDPNILVITLAQLQTIIQKQTQVFSPPPSAEKATSKKCDSSVKIVENKKQKHKHEEKAKNFRHGHLIDDSHRHRSNSSPLKHSSRLEEPKSEMFNESLNQMMWLPYLQQLEAAALAFGGGGGGGGADILKGFNFPFLPIPGGQIPGLGPMIPPNRIPTHHQPPIPFQQAFDYNSLFEYPNWQEALHQANFLRSKSQFDFNNKNMYPGYPEISPDSLRRSHNSNAQKFLHQYNRSFPHSNNNKGNMMRNFPSSSSRDQPIKQNLQIPQYHPPSGSSKNQSRRMSSNFLMQPEIDSTVSSKPSGHKNVQINSAQNSYKCHSSDNISVDKVGSQIHLKSSLVDGIKKNHSDNTLQPMDLSTSQVTSNKIRDKSCFENIKPAKQSHKHHDEVAEVGSTTASFEDIAGHHGHDSQKFLWHPLFSNQKPSSSSWNWTTLTATGE